MKTEKLKYYRFRDTGRIARQSGYDFQVFFEGRMAEDEDMTVSDTLHGYDPSEPAGSPYRYGDTSIMDSIEEITYEEAMDCIGRQTVSYLLAKWKEDFREKKEEWDTNSGWPSKLVSTEFILYGMRYTIEVDDIYPKSDPFDEGFVESMQKEMEKDLVSFGAEEIKHFGFLD